MKKQKFIQVPKQLNTLDKKQTLRASFSRSTVYLTHYYIYYKMLKLLTQKFYKYGLALVKIFKKLTTFDLLKKTMLLYPFGYIFFPFHKMTKSIFLKDVNFYTFFLNNLDYNGFVLNKAVFRDVKHVSKNGFYSVQKDLYGGLNYYVNIKTLNYNDYTKKQNINTQKNLTLTNPSIVFKGLINTYSNYHFDSYLSILFYDVIFYLYMLSIKEYYKLVTNFIWLK